MKSLLNQWRYNEDRLASIRKNLCDKGVSVEAALEDTAEDQCRNNRLYDSIWKKGQYRRTVCGLV